MTAIRQDNEQPPTPPSTMRAVVLSQLTHRR